MAESTSAVMRRRLKAKPLATRQHTHPLGAQKIGTNPANQWCNVGDGGGGGGDDGDAGGDGDADSGGGGDCGGSEAKRWFADEGEE